MTIRDDHVTFRNQAEGMIKSFQFGPWDGQTKAPDVDRFCTSDAATCRNQPFEWSNLAASALASNARPRSAVMR